ncbi:MAG: cation:proton antiporter [Austwickia sp.]|nr:cation:proton antiporter [Austwickia sp.]
MPILLRRVALSAPIVLVLVGLGIGSMPLPQGFDVDPTTNPAAIEHLTELTVIVALMGVGLALDRPLSLRSWASWRRWHATWRLLAIGMPLAILGTGVLGMGVLGLGAGSSLLLGAALAPTDPVLAADVQVEGPSTEELDDIGERDEVRFALTSEAGFNDALAFPFVYAAIFLAEKQQVGDFLLRWLSWELVGKTLLGAAIGVACGLALGRVAFHGHDTLRLAEKGEPLLALAATFVAYGLAEVVGGWGFLAVFACALAIRGMERGHEYHAEMHDLVEQIELLLTLLVLLLLGVSFADGLLGYLDWRGFGFALLVLFVVRPVTAGLALLGSDRHVRGQGEVGLGPRERLVTAFFGVRGIGSVYYLAYAFGAAAFPEQSYLWSVVGATILLSVIVHGVLATPAMRWVEAKRAERATDTV